MHCLADIVVATEREREVADATTDMCTRQILMNPCSRPDEVGSIGIMFLHTCGHCQHVRIEDDILRLHTYPFCQELIGSLSNLNTTFIGGSLSLFVETHHHHSSSQPLHILRMGDESFFTFFE